MTREEEKIILQRIRKGESDLYAEIVRTYSSRVLSLVTGMLGLKEDAEEITQDIFVKAYFSLDKFRGDSSFSTWLFRIAYNMSVSSLRKKKSIFVRADNLAHLPDEEEVPPGESNQKEERLVLLERMLAELTEEERFLILLYYNEDKSIKEIAEITGLTESNIKIKLFRIKNKIREKTVLNPEVCYG